MCVRVFFFVCVCVQDAFVKYVTFHAITNTAWTKVLWVRSDATFPV